MVNCKHLIDGVDCQLKKDRYAEVGVDGPAGCPVVTNPDYDCYAQAPADTLAPCPFCGSEARVVSHNDEYAVQCMFKGTCYGASAIPGSYGFRFKEDAVNLWNERTPLNISELINLYRRRESALLNMVNPDV